MVLLRIALLGVLGLAACTPFGVPTRSISLGQGTVTANAPTGYCVDTMSSQPRRDFAVFAPCATLGADDAPPAVIGVATVQVGPADSGSIVDDEGSLRDFLISDAGTSLLTATGDAENVRVLSSQAFNGRVMIHFVDSGPPSLAGLQQQEWRGFTNIDGHLVTVGVRGLAAAPLNDGPGAALLKLMLAGIISSEPETQEVAPDA